VPPKLPRAHPASMTAIGVLPPNAGTQGSPRQEYCGGRPCRAGWRSGALAGCRKMPLPLAGRGHHPDPPDMGLPFRADPETQRVSPPGQGPQSRQDRSRSNAGQRPPGTGLGLWPLAGQGAAERYGRGDGPGQAEGACGRGSWCPVAGPCGPHCLTRVSASGCHDRPQVRGWHNAAGTLAAASGAACRVRSRGFRHPCRMFPAKKAPEPGAFPLLARRSGRCKASGQEVRHVVAHADHRAVVAPVRLAALIAVRAGATICAAFASLSGYAVKSPMREFQSPDKRRHTWRYLQRRNSPRASTT